MRFGELTLLVEAYRDGTISAADAQMLADTIRRQDMRAHAVVQQIRMAGLLDQALDQISPESFTRGFLERLRAEEQAAAAGDGTQFYEEVTMTSQLMPVAGERIEAEEQDRRDDLTLAAALQQQWQSAPWYVSSVAIHAVIFLFLLLLPVEPAKAPVRRLIIECELVQEQEKIEEPENDIVERDPEIVTDQTNPEPAPVIVTTDFEIADHNETDDDMEMETARGDPDSVSTFDDVEGSPALMGVGASGGKGGGGRFGYRDGGGKRNAVARGGGSRKTESAVDWALQWLAEHQEPDGHWDNVKYGGGAENRRGGKLGGDQGDVAVTSLAALAFLGAGNSTKFGKYKTNVHRAVYWLKSKQNEDGSIGATDAKKGYSWGIALMAMSEAYGMSNDAELKRVAQRCVDWAVKAQCPAGGWNYTPHSTRNDTSVTGWWIMGLKSAKVAGLNIPYEVLEKALKYIQHATTDPAGDKGYGGTCRVSYDSNTENVEQVKRGGGSMRLTAVGLTCLQFLGRPRTDPQVIGCANQVMADGMPDANAPIGTNDAPNAYDFYRWYYAALGLFQMGVKGEYWRKWNDPMKTALLETQVKAGTFKENKGSWNPERDAFGGNWGRVGQTAIGALMLEVYYRYYDCHQKR